MMTRFGISQLNSCRMGFMGWPAPSQAQSDTPLGHWLKGLLERTHRNVATVALANKLARIAWAVLAHDRRYVAVHTAAD
jgi:transposase